jgi:hypothetical protein
MHRDHSARYLKGPFGSVCCCAGMLVYFRAVHQAGEPPGVLARSAVLVVLLLWRDVWIGSRGCLLPGELHGSHEYADSQAQG